MKIHCLSAFLLYATTASAFQQQQPVRTNPRLLHLSSSSQEAWKEQYAKFSTQNAVRALLLEEWLVVDWPGSFVLFHHVLPQKKRLDCAVAFLYLVAHDSFFHPRFPLFFSSFTARSSPRHDRQPPRQGQRKAATAASR